jgi:diguanylate cyclase (GGDEF)-like protein
MVNVRLEIPARVDRLIYDPRQAVTIFWGAGTIAGATAVPLVHWRHGDAATMVVLVCCAAAATLVRAASARRLADWTLNVDAVAAVTILSWATALGLRAQVDFAVLYLYLAVFSGLYFDLVRGAVIWLYAAVSFAVVLAVSPSAPERVFTGLSIIGTGTLVYAVVHLLVGILQLSSREDPLTRLPNRRTWDERVDEEIERSRRGGSALSLVIVDVDGFKAINDARGHAEGDLILRALADGWRATLRGGGDVVARIGGDEFGVICPGSDEAAAVAVVERLRGVSPSGVTCSFGAATWDRAESAASLFRRADEQMYRAKRAGR